MRRDLVYRNKGVSWYYYRSN